MNLNALRRLATDKAAPNFPERSERLAFGSEFNEVQYENATIIMNRRHTRYWLLYTVMFGGRSTHVGAAETGSQRVAKEWLSHFTRDEMLPAGRAMVGMC